MLLSDVIGIAGPALEVAIILLLLRKSLWRVYTFLFIYALWLFVGNSAILATFLYFSKVYPDFPNAYPALYWNIYWNIDSIDVVLRFVVVWEVFRQTFPKSSGLNKSLSKGLGVIAFSLLAFASGTFLIYQNYIGPRSIHLALDRTFGFVQALMILGTLATARYYGVKCGRNIRGIALAFGCWVSISTATNAMADLTSSFLTYWYYLRPLSFVVMIAVWIWALWVYEPNPPISESEPVELNQWTEEWNRTISAARTIIRP
jgi:hypothetical protein